VAWVALAPLLITLLEGSLSRAFGLGLLCGLVSFTGTVYWITNVLATYGSLQTWVAVLVNGALIAFLALFPALFAVMVRLLVQAAGLPALLLSPVLWVTTELGRTYVLGGFPWVLLGYSQTGVLPVSQLASVVGVYGVSALVATVSAAAASAAASPSRSVARLAPLAVALALVGAASVWGSWRVSTGALLNAGQPIRVGLVQGNVDQAEKWDPRRAADIFETYLRMTNEAIAGGAELVIWPEASMPFTFEEDRGPAERVRRTAQRARVSILLGSNEIERGPVRHLYNSAFLVRPDGATGGVYRKMHLVPFGEYVPLQQLLFFAAPLVEAVSAFSPGEAPVLLAIGEHRVSTAICYEVVYPALVRRFVTEGSELLTTITNDAWFGPSSAPYQHFQQAAMRAIENGRYLVRSANTGISGVVDPYGRVVTESRLFEPAVITADARLLKNATVYARTGDLFAYACAVMTLALLVQAGRRRRRIE
jgi:apolipoprotein N-acyltransferase